MTNPKYSSLENINHKVKNDNLQMNKNPHTHNDIKFILNERVDYLS